MPSLKRIILINSHLPGVVELNLDGHTNICGTNASGKTTLQRLLPIFYGEYPSRVVPATRDSFERWYLPTQGSFIIYEYQNNEQQLCQVVLAPAIEGKGVNYRFIHRGFELEDYILQKNEQADNSTNKQLKCMTMAELRRALKQSDVLHTRLLNTREFRAIIQNDRSLINTGKNKNDLRLFARQFSLCETGQTLRHIEKLTRAVHSKEGKMETIKAMIAAILEEDGVTTPAYNLDPKKVDNWISESKLVQGFEAMRPDFEKLESENQQLLLCEKQLIGLEASFQHDRSIQWQQQEENRKTLSELQEKQQSLNKEWDCQRDELNNELSATRADIRSIEKELDQIEEQYNRYLEKNIDQMKQQLEQLPGWKDELENLNDQLRLMLAEHQDLEADYQKRLNTINSKLNQSLQNLDQDKDRLSDEQNEKKNQRNEIVARFEKQLSQRQQELKDSYSQQKSEIQLKQKELQVYIDSVHYTSEEQLQLDVFENRLNQSNDEIEISRQKLDELKERQFKQQKDVALADQQLLKSTQTLHQCQQETEQLNHFLNPKKNSLLSSLRKENPGWEMNLGKVINPELLQRTDLKPDYPHKKANRNTATLYGLNLDLDSIELPDYALAEKQYEQQLNQAEEKEHEARNFQTEARQKLDNAHSILEELKKEIILASTEYKKQKNNHTHLVEEKNAYKKELEAALRDRKDELRKKVSIIKRQADSVTELFESNKDKLNQDSEEERLEITAHWQEVLQTIDEKISKNKEIIITRRRQAKIDQKSCENWYQQQCKERGIDQQQLNFLESQQEELQTKITSTEKSRDEVLEYDFWYQKIWLLKKPEQQQQLTKDRTRFEKLERQFSTQQQHYKEERERTQKAQKQAQNDFSQAETFLQRINSLLNKFKSLRLKGDTEQAIGEISERLRKGEDLLLQREKSLDEVKHYIEHFDALIANQSGASLAETWERSREEFTLFNEQGIRQLNHRKLVEPLAIILNKMVPQSIHALREQGRNFGIELNGFYDVLDNIDRKITSQSNRITKEVDEDLSLDGVSNSAVRIRSRISELDFWPELKVFITAFDEWQDEGFNSMPNENYINSIRRAIDIIGRSAFTGGVSSLLEIELHLREGTSDLIIRTDRQLNESSSHGMAYMILCKFLLAFTRLLRNKAAVTIHWPIDELGTLHHDNIKKIFDACKNNNIQILGAFPNPDSAVLNLFANRYIINKQTKELQTIKPKLNTIAEKIKQHQAIRETQ